MTISLAQQKPGISIGDAVGGRREAGRRNPEMKCSEMQRAAARKVSAVTGGMYVLRAVSNIIN
jgi:hypothetical protein